MGTKQVRLSEDVYAKIEDKKQPDESFSDAIDRLTSDWSLAGWAGWMSDADAERHSERVSELEAADRRETEALADDLGIDPE